MADSGFWSRVGWSVLVVAAFLVLGVLLLGLVWQVIGSQPGSPLVPRIEQRGEDGTIIQVEVRNGVGSAGLAAEMTVYLRRYGYDVVESGNWRSFDVAETYVIDRVGSRPTALRLARLIGLSESAIVENIDARPLVDVTVVIGRDYAGLPPFQDRPSR
jgi:hypothetical protein